MQQTRPYVSIPGLTAQIARDARALLRRDGLVIMLMVVVTMIVTYPVPFGLSRWIIGGGRDVLQALWQDWWMRKALTEGHSLTYTTHLFYPYGADLTFNAQHWSTLPIWWPLSVVVGDVAAGNLTLLASLAMSGYFAYLLGLYLTRNRMAALLSGMVFAFFPYHARQLGRSMSHLQWFPLFMLAFVYSLRTRKAIHILLAALALSLSTLTHQRLVIFPVLAGAVYTLYHLPNEGQWRSGRTWAALALFAALAIAFNLPSMLPFLRLTAQQMAQALSKGTGRGVDLLDYVCPPPVSPLLSPLLRAGAPICHEGSYLYLGIITTALAMVGLMLGKPREWLPWAVMAALFLALSLGSTLRINGKSFPNIWMPYRTLRVIPIFGVIRHPERFIVSLLLPLSVLAGYGAAHILARLRADRARVVLVMVLAGLTLAEYWLGPVHRQSSQVSPYYHQLADEPGHFAVIELPMGRAHSKEYMFNQTIHGKPMVEGMISRPVGDPYAYIKSNPVLAAWQEAEPLPCDPGTFGAAVGELLNYGFRYVIVHPTDTNDQPINPALLSAFEAVEPIYHDEVITVYDLRSLRDAPPACPG